MDDLKEILQEKRGRYTMPPRTVLELQARAERHRRRRMLSLAMTVVIAAGAVAGGFGIRALTRSSATPIPGHQPQGTNAEAACAFRPTFHGRLYRGVAVQIAPIAGPSAGFAVEPGCNDTGGTGAPSSRIEVFRFPGLAPSVAVVMDEETVLVPTSTTQLPPAVAALVHAPTCQVSDTPIALRGPWLGILGADGKTEVDLIPPYDLFMRATTSSSPRYERARLTIGVPRALGQPISHQDVADSLWKGGSIAITAVCDGEGFLATAVRAITAGS